MWASGLPRLSSLSTVGHHKTRRNHDLIQSHVLHKRSHWSLLHINKNDEWGAPTSWKLLTDPHVLDLKNWQWNKAQRGCRRSSSGDHRCSSRTSERLGENRVLVDELNTSTAVFNKSTVYVEIHNKNQLINLFISMITAEEESFCSRWSWMFQQSLPTAARRSSSWFQVDFGLFLGWFLSYSFRLESEWNQADFRLISDWILSYWFLAGFESRFRLVSG